MSGVQQVTFVCLANSWKHGGHCIAGKALEWPYRWYRPVSARPGHELNEFERQYADGSEPQLLDVVDFAVAGRQPAFHQRENWLIAHPATPPQKRGKLTIEQTVALLEYPHTLWGTHYSSRRGQNDRLPTDVAAACRESLYLIRAAHAEAVAEYTGSGRKRLRLRFRYRSDDYSIAVTDPVFTAGWIDQLEPGDRLSIGEAILTVSLGEELAGYCYKLAAGIIPIRPGEIELRRAVDSEDELDST